MNSLMLNQAYRFVALALMLVQVNLVCRNLELPLDHPITESDVRPGGHIGPASMTNYSGNVLTDRYFFGFGKGHVANFWDRRFKPNSEAEIKRQNIELAKQTSLIDTNGAHLLAIKWLQQLNVDVPILEKKYRLNIIQWRYHRNDKPSGQLEEANQSFVVLPVYEVEWRGALPGKAQRYADVPIVTLTINGATKELMEYHLLDDSLILSPRVRIKDSEKLLAIPDSEFANYDATQRSNLVTRFSVKTNESAARN